MSSAMRQLPKALLICLFLLALTPRLLYLISIPREAILESVDAQGYERLAQNLRSGHGFSLQDAPPYQSDGLRTPLYPIFVGAVYALAGTRTGPVAVATIQAILDSLTALLVGAVAGALLGRWGGIGATLLYAFTPVQWRYAAALLTEIPTAFLISLAVWSLVKLKQNVHVSGTRWAIACGAIVGLAALCKPNAGGLTLILPFAAWAAFWDHRHQTRRPVLVKGLVGASSMLLTSIVVISPWLIRNWAVFGRPFLSNAGLGYLARVAAPATLGVVEKHQVLPWSQDWEARYHAVVSQAAARHGWRVEPAAPLSPSEADVRERQIAQVAFEIVLDHPSEALRAHMVGFIRSWAPQEQTFWYTHLSGRAWVETGVAANTLRDAVEIFLDGRPFEAFDHALIQPWERLDPLGRVLWYGWVLGHLVTTGLMGVGVWRLRQRPALTLAMVAIILCTTLPPGPIGYVRFRVPVIPLITVLAMAGLVFPRLASTLPLPDCENEVTDKSPGSDHCAAT